MCFKWFCFGVVCFVFAGLLRLWVVLWCVLIIVCFEWCELVAVLDFWVCWLCCYFCFVIGCWLLLVVYGLLVDFAGV